jgi:hypothetical protein
MRHCICVKKFYPIKNSSEKAGSRSTQDDCGPEILDKKKNNNKRHIEPSTVAASAVPVAFSNRTEVNGVPLYQNHRNLTYRIYRIKLEPGSVYVVLTISHTGPDKYYGQENQWPHLELKKNIFN